MGINDDLNSSGDQLVVDTTSDKRYIKSKNTLKPGNNADTSKSKNLAKKSSDEFNTRNMKTESRNRGRISTDNVNVNSKLPKPSFVRLSSRNEFSTAPSQSASLTKSIDSVKQSKSLVRREITSNRNNSASIVNSVRSSKSLKGTVEQSCKFCSTPNCTALSYIKFNNSKKSTINMKTVTSWQPDNKLIEISKNICDEPESYLTPTGKKAFNFLKLSGSDATSCILDMSSHSFISKNKDIGSRGRSKHRMRVAANSKELSNDIIESRKYLIHLSDDIEDYLSQNNESTLKEIRKSDSLPSNKIWHINNNIPLNRYCGRPLSAQNEAELSMKLPKLPGESLKTLFFDLDQTLVFVSMNRSIGRPPDFEFPLETTNYEKTSSELVIRVDYDPFFVQSKKRDIYMVYLRPLLHAFLEELSDKFEIVIFTAAEKYYADKVINAIDPDERIIKHRFYREHCTKCAKGRYVKEIWKCGRYMSNCILVDNSMISFGLNFDNGLLVPSYNGNENDSVLFHLLPILLRLSTVENVRPHLQAQLQLPFYVEQFRSILCSGWIEHLLQLAQHNLYQYTNIKRDVSPMAVNFLKKTHQKYYDEKEDCDFNDLKLNINSRDNISVNSGKLVLDYNMHLPKNFKKSHK